MDWVACVGIDWGDQRHSYVIHSQDGARKRGEVGSSPDDVHAWVRRLREQFPTGTILVALEQGRGSLVYALASYADLAVVPINPRASKAYRESRRLSGASSDPLDADLICDFLLKHLSELRVWKADDEITRELRLLVENRRTLVDQRTGFTHALAATLKEYFPQSLQWFGGETSSSLRGFLRRWPTLEKLRRATYEEIAQTMREQRRRKIDAAAKELLQKIAIAVPLTCDAAIIEAYSMYAQSLVAIVETLDSQIVRYDESIAALWADHPDRDVFNSLPGAGPVMAPRLAVAFGLDRSRYHDAEEVQCYSGIAPVTETSGRRIWVHARWGYPKFLHQTFHEFAQASIPQSSWAKAFYQQQRERGADHHEAIRSLAFRWIRVLYRLWQTEDTYDESYYIDALTRKKSPLASRLVA